ncbi:MAG: hypothetical protein ACYDAD_00915 [Acidimicrobiales bacterium]
MRRVRAASVVGALIGSGLGLALGAVPAAALAAAARGSDVGDTTHFFGQAGAQSTGYSQTTDQPGATIGGSTVYESDVPFTRVQLEATVVQAKASVDYPGDFVADFPALLRGNGVPVPDDPLVIAAAYPASGPTGRDAQSGVSGQGGVEAGSSTVHAVRTRATAHSVGTNAAPGASGSNSASSWRSASTRQPPLHLSAAQMSRVRQAVASLDRTSGRRFQLADDAVVRAESLATDSDALYRGGRLSAQATSTGRGVSIAGGLVRIGRYRSVSDASSDGVRGKGKGQTVVSEVSVAGRRATLDGTGLHLSGSGGGGSTAAMQHQLDQALGVAGVEVALGPSRGGADRATPALGAATAGGIEVVIRSPDQLTVTQRFSLGAGRATAFLLRPAAGELAPGATRSPSGPGVVSPGLNLAEGAGAIGGAGIVGSAAGAGPEPAGARSAGTVAGAMAPATAAGGVRASTGPRRLLADSHPTLPRRGLGGWLLVGLLLFPSLLGGWLGFARWQLLDWLPEPVQGGGPR